MLDIKNIIFFTSGVITGVTGMYIYMKKKLNSEKELKEAIINEYDEYFGLTDSYTRVNDDEEEEYVNPEDSRQNGILSEEKRKEIKEKLEKNRRITTDYAKIYRKYNKSTEESSIEEEDPEEDEEEESEDERINSDYKENKDRAPKIISENSLGDLPEYYETKCLYYYTEDEVLTDDEDNPIEDPEYILGNCLTKYGFTDPENEEMSIFVQNFGSSTVYEVQKLTAAFHQ